MIFSQEFGTRPGSTVSNVSGYRCLSDCRSRSHGFDPGPAGPYLAKIDHEIISMVILLIYTESLKKDCCQLEMKIYAKVLVNRLFKLRRKKCA